MKNTIDKYKNGDMYAKEDLIEYIVEEHNYNITRDEAIILLYKKYGKPEIF